MGGCLAPQKSKKPVPTKPKNNKPKQQQQPDTKPIRNDAIKQVINIPIQKHKKIYSYEILGKYCIEQTLQNAARMQGPKYLSNFVDGSCKVMRIYNSDDFDEERLVIYKQLLNLEVFEDEEKNIIVFDEYVCGKSIKQLVEDQYQSDTKYNETIKRYILAVFNMIKQFHKKRMWLGNLQIDSFRYVSPTSQQIKLVTYNMKGVASSSIGFAHSEGYESDWQFLGYLIKYVTSQWTPIFVSHKMQYSSSDDIIPSKLLRGQKIDLQTLTNAQFKFIKTSKSVIYGYKFRQDLNNLLQIRKKRKMHSYHYYSGQILSKSKAKSVEQILNRLQTQKIMNRIQQYIENVTKQCQEPFMSYCAGGDKFKRLQQVFLLKDVQKKMSQLRETLSTIR